MEYVKKKLKDIKPYENNPRIIDDAVDDVMESIRQCGYVAPIIVDEDGVIVKKEGEDLQSLGLGGLSENSLKEPVLNLTVKHPSHVVILTANYKEDGSSISGRTCENDYQCSMRNDNPIIHKK